MTQPEKEKELFCKGSIVNKRKVMGNGLPLTGRNTPKEGINFGEFLYLGGGLGGLVLGAEVFEEGV